MPNNPQQHSDPQVDRYLKDNPQFRTFFENYPIPDSTAVKPKLNRDINDPNLQDYANEIYDKGVSSDELYNNIGGDPGKIGGYFTALKKMSGGAKSPEMSDYINNINKRYGKDSKVVYDPDSEKLTAILPGDPKYDALLQKGSNWRSTMGGQGATLDQKEPDQKEPTYTRRLSKVSAAFDDKTQVNTPDGVVFKDPGWKFYKVYDDGSREEIDENNYQTMKAFNALPANLKSKYVEKVNLSTLTGKNKEIANQKMALLKKVTDDN